MHKLLLLLIFTSGYTAIRAQTSDSAVIRMLEEKLKSATMNGDTATFFKYMAPEMIVNTPVNRVATLDMVRQFTRGGEIAYAAFDLRIEKITVIDNVAISMGQETVVPKDNTNHLGKTVTRRYTDIWMKRKGAWLMVGRQSTEISVQ